MLVGWPLRGCTAHAAYRQSGCRIQIGDDDLCSSTAVLDFDRYLFALATNKTAVNAANTPAVTANMNG